MSAGDGVALGSRPRDEVASVTVESRPHPAAPATTVGRYHLLERIGIGTMGEVWRAEDPQIGRTVAVKLLRWPDGFDEARREDWQRRFSLEAKAAGRLSHPGIVSVHDVGEAADGRPFIVMELVRGRSLDAYVRYGVRAEPGLALEWIAQVAEALDAAHRSGTVHRDVKPANILVDADGRARIADFGIARLADSEATREGTFLGSPAYASPEQIRGAGVDGRSDLFSLGAVAYVLLTGRKPFRGDDLAGLTYAICHEAPAPLSWNGEFLPKVVQDVVLRSLSKRPGDRFQTGRGMAEAVREAAASIERDTDRARGPADGETSIERTLVDADRNGREQGGRTVSDALERRAAELGSLTAVGIVRAASIAVHALRRFAAGGAAVGLEWAARVTAATRRHSERVLGGLAAPRRRTVVVSSTALLGVMVVFALIAAVFRGGSSLSWIGAIVGERVDVRVEHGLPEGTLTIRTGSGVRLRESLAAPERKLRLGGVEVLSRRSGTEEWSMRLPRGRHELTVEITTSDGTVSLSRTISVDIEAGAANLLDISLRLWPRPRMAVDWSRSSAAGNP